jgi:hypothetical protein
LFQQSLEHGARNQSLNCSPFHKTAVGTNVEGERSEKEGHMKTIRFLVFRAFLLIAFITTYLYFLYGQERRDAVPIVRNVAWNDLVHQVDPSANDSPHETLGKEFVLIQKFLSEHQLEVSVRIYDITVFRAIDQARARLQKADKDLEMIKNELAYKEVQAKVGR